MEYNPQTEKATVMNIIGCIRQRGWGVHYFLRAVFVLFFTVMFFSASSKAEAGSATTGETKIQATSLSEDIKDIAELRGKLEKAFPSGRPEAVGELITDDFVYLQPNAEGPNIYGKEYYLKYLPSLNPVLKMSIKPLKDIIVFSSWAIEVGEEHMEVVIAGDTVPQVARYMKILYREPKDGWKYARVITGMARDLASHKAPPQLGFITYAGWGHWGPRVSPESVDEMIAAEKQNIRKMIATQDKYAVYEFSWPHDDDFLYSVGPSGIGTYKDYKARKKSCPRYIGEELEKYTKEAIVGGDYGFQWGHSVGSRVNRDSGVRRYGVSQFMHIFRKNEKNVWKLFDQFNL